MYHCIPHNFLTDDSDEFHEHIMSWHINKYYDEINRKVEKTKSKYKGLFE